MSALVVFGAGCGAIIAGGALALLIWEGVERLNWWLQDRAGRRIGRRWTDHIQQGGTE